MRLNRVCYILFQVVFFFTASHAQQEMKGRFLTLDSAITLGVQHSRQVELSGAKVNESKSTQEDIKNRIIPSLDLSVGYTRLSNIPIEYFNIPGFPGEIPSTVFFPIILNNYSATASLNESVFNGFQYKYALQSFGYKEKSSEFSLESDKKTVTLNIITAYINLFKLQRAHILMEESIDQITAHVKEVTDFSSHGLATQNDVLRTQLQLSNTELTEIDIKSQIETVNFNLDIMLGLPENTEIEIDSNSVSDGKSVQPLPYYLQNYLQNRNDIKAADMQQKAAETDIKQTQSNLYPHLIVGADYDYLRPNPRIVPPLDEFQSTWDIGFHITYSLTNLYDNKTQCDVSRARLEEAKATYNQLSDNAKMEINGDYLQYKQSLEKVDVAEKSLNQAQENYKLVKSRYDNHIALLTDLLDANNYLLNAQINLISSKADATIAYYSLQKAAGEFTITK